MNGGTCVGPETCDCVTGWTGTYCGNGLFLQLLLLSCECIPNIVCTITIKRFSMLAKIFIILYIQILTSVLLVQVDANRIVTTLLVDIPVHVIMDSHLKMTDTAVQVGIFCTTKIIVCYI